MSWDLHRKPKPFLQREIIAFMQLATACDQWMPTRDQLNALGRYCATGYETYNNRLRGIDSFFEDRWDAEEFAWLDGRIAAMAAIEPVLAPADMIIWRGVRIPAGSAPSLGQVWTEEGFMSCTISRARAEKAVRGYKDLDRANVTYEPWLFKLCLRAGDPIIPTYWAMLNDPERDNARASSRDPQPYFVNEAGITLLPGSQIICDKVRQRADGVHVAEARIVAPAATASLAA